MWPNATKGWKCPKLVFKICVVEISNVNISRMVCPIEVILSPSERVVRAPFHSVYNITRRKVRLLVSWWDFVITKIASWSGWKYFYLGWGLWYGRIFVWRMFHFRSFPAQKSCQTSCFSSFQLSPPSSQKMEYTTWKLNRVFMCCHRTHIKIFIIFPSR